MTSSNKLSNLPFQPTRFPKPLLIGAGIALLLIALFLSGVHDPDPAWGTYWMVKPLVVVPIAGAMGGAFYYMMDQLSFRNGFNRTLAILLGLIGYVIVLWLGSIIGLNGTLWN